MTHLLRPRRPLPATIAWVLVLVAAIPGCGSGGGGGRDDPGSTFRLLTSTPLSSSVNVPRDQVVMVRLTEAVDPASVRPDTVTVRTALQQIVAGSTAHIPGGNGSEIRWTPAALMPPSADLVATVASDLRSMLGSTLGRPATISFRTAPTVDPHDLPRQNDLRAALGGLAVGRQRHVATKLPDGRVLVAGGFLRQPPGVGLFTDVLETFDPVEDRFFTQPYVLRRARAMHAQILLADGRVLVCGGRIESSPGVLAVTDESELVTPGIGCVSTGSMNTARYDHAVVRLADGRVLVCGGTDAGGADLDDAEVFDPQTGTWTVFPGRMNARRATHGIVPFGPDRYLVMGGSVTARYAEVLDVVAGTFTSTNVPEHEGQRFGPVVGVYASGAAMLAGGDLTGNVVYAYAGSGFLQNSGSPLSRPRSYATATRIGPDRFFIVGGIDFANEWLDGTCDVVIEGGVGGSGTFATEVAFPTGMASHTATLLDDGNVMFCGGININGQGDSLKATYILEVD